MRDERPTPARDHGLWRPFAPRPSARLVGILVGVEIRPAQLPHLSDLMTPSTGLLIRRSEVRVLPGAPQAVLIWSPAGLRPPSSIRKAIPSPGFMSSIASGLERSSAYLSAHARAVVARLRIRYPHGY